MVVMLPKIGTTKHRRRRKRSDWEFGSNLFQLCLGTFAVGKVRLAQTRLFLLLLLPLTIFPPAFKVIAIAATLILKPMLKEFLMPFQAILSLSIAMPIAFPANLYHDYAIAVEFPAC